MDKERPHYKIRYLTYDIGKNVDSFFLDHRSQAFWYSRFFEGPSDLVSIESPEAPVEEEMAQKIVFMIEASSSW